MDGREEAVALRSMLKAKVGLYEALTTTLITEVRENYPEGAAAMEKLRAAHHALFNEFVEQEGETKEYVGGIYERVGRGGASSLGSSFTMAHDRAAELDGIRAYVSVHGVRQLSGAAADA